jgi:hypothetical protein
LRVPNISESLLLQIPLMSAYVTDSGQGEELENKLRIVMPDSRLWWQVSGVLELLWTTSTHVRTDT